MKEPMTKIMEIPDRIGKMMSCLFSLSTLKLFMEICQPLDKRVKNDILVYFRGFTINPIYAINELFPSRQ